MKKIYGIALILVILYGSLITPSNAAEFFDSENVLNRLIEGAFKASDKQ